MSLTRRQALTAAGLSAAATVLPDGRSALAVTPGQLSDIEHVVICMQENRSFDHYFGSLRGVIGFGDPNAMSGVFMQADPAAATHGSVLPYVMPWRFDTTTTSGQAFGGLSHAWGVEHPSWNNGLMDGFVAAHRVADDLLNDSTNNAPGTMGFFTRADIPWQYSLADAYTVCDRYHASVFGPTNPNRIMSMSATIDPDGTMGGPCLDNGQSVGQLQWTSYPERLQAAGIDWWLYQEKDNFDDNMLPFFKGFSDTTTDLYRRGNTFIPTPAGAQPGPALIAKLRADVVSGNLPQVSWVVGSAGNSEHPAASPAYGARFVDGVIKALQADPKVWAKTVLFLNFDENDGFFDHVLPPTAPANTPGEWVTAATALANASATDSFSGPVGLSFRVPMTIVSPWTRGGLVCSDVFDHTSTLLFLEKRFGVEVPNISAWRRKTVGDLTSAFNFAAGADLSIPTLPDADALAKAADVQSKLPAAVAPATPTMPTQESGTKARPSGIVAVPVAARPVVRTAKAPSGSRPASKPVVTPTGSLAATGLDEAATVATAAALVAGAALALRRRGEGD